MYVSVLKGTGNPGGIDRLERLTRPHFSSARWFEHLRAAGVAILTSSLPPTARRPDNLAALVRTDTFVHNAVPIQCERHPWNNAQQLHTSPRHTLASSWACEVPSNTLLLEDTTSEKEDENSKTSTLLIEGKTDEINGKVILCRTE